MPAGSPLCFDHYPHFALGDGEVLRLAIYTPSSFDFPIENLEKEWIIAPDK